MKRNVFAFLMLVSDDIVWACNYTPSAAGA